METLTITSWLFVCVCLGGAISTWAPHMVRKFILLFLSLGAVFLFSQTVSGFLAILIFCFVIYGIAKLKKSLGNWTGTMTVLVVVLLWVFLFFIKGPDIFGPVNPFFHFPVSIVGVSYLTFRAISYVVDVELFEDGSLMSFLIYMTFFPTILAGPIERYDEFEEELNAARPVTVDFEYCAHRITAGAIMKFVIADNLAPMGVFAIGAGFADYGMVMLWLSTLLQLAIIFFDFAGYTAMMIGIAGLCGIKLSENFDKFWRARNVLEFWQRWHMTMTSFIRDYIFTPLMRWGIEKFDAGKVWIFAIFANFFTIMLIALWHEPTVGYFWFGILHGLAITLTQIWKRILPLPLTGAAGLIFDNVARVFTYVFVSLTMIVWYFSADQSQSILLKLFGL